MKKFKIHSKAAQDARFESILGWAERALWMAFCLGTSALAFESFLHFGRPWFEPVFYTRFALCTTAAVALIWLLAERRLPELAASVYLLAWMGSQSLYLLLSGTVSPALLEFSGALLVTAAILFRGPRWVWWWGLAPAGAISILAPLVSLGTSRVRGVQFDEFWMALGGPALAILIASLISVVRDTRLLSLEARSEMRSVLADQLRLMRTLRELERRTKSILNITQPEPISQEPEVAVGTAVTVEAGAPASKALTADTALSMDTADIIDSTTSEAALIEAEVNPLESLTALSSESLSEQDGKSIGVPELSNLLEAVIQEVRASRAENHQGTKVRFIVSGALDSAVAVSVRGVKETLTDVLRALILHSAESIGGGSDGVVRATWRLNVANVQLIIEDNGRGMSEDLLLRLEEKNQSGTGRLRLAQVRAQLAEVEGRVELSARLGVGSRIVLELQRTDALVASTAPQKPRTAPIRQAREPIAIGREALQTN